MAVMWFISGIPGWRNWYDIDDFAVFGRLFVEVNDGEEIRGDLRLVLRSDVEDLFGSPAVLVLGKGGSPSAEAENEDEQQPGCSHTHTNRILWNHQENLSKREG
jgi:hypothetical protein